ncbi:hypothetical protein KHC23_14345 [Ancylobacter dichloromethanicus]|uniref:Uncharacterized protein n=1 Tax=Ancylobacter dichloromethanicus TaxID=518825 RepID=A0A9W6JC43_9HYPH|nr:hypothetical protein [Ancylobacter dichloromethanicus]MBS7554828.1 hypothetical protein [Ancylobacter dichloromethanicus]GLK74272.1 hypothetical protein GCM10017643_43900 [Ancylobacter dichloromethanicus]
MPIGLPVDIPNEGSDEQMLERGRVFRGDPYWERSEGRALAPQSINLIGKRR